VFCMQIGEAGTLLIDLIHRYQYGQDVDKRKGLDSIRHPQHRHTRHFFSFSKVHTRAKISYSQNPSPINIGSTVPSPQTVTEKGKYIFYSSNAME
jgi:hypothetical protein